MIAQFTRFLARKNLVPAANAFITAVSYLSGKRINISYQNGFWRHKFSDNVINDTIPNYKLDAAALFKEVEEIYLDGYVPSSGDICIDVGAGIGIETIYLARHIGNGKVYSIEAATHTYALLAQNIKDNNLNDKVLTCNLAISDSPGQVHISASTDQHINNSILGKEGDLVEAVTMDDFISARKIKQIDYLKVNIEGAEKFLIRSFKQVAKVKHIAISCHDFLGKRNNDPSLFTRQEVIAFLKEAGFAVTTRNTGIDFVDDWVFGKRPNNLQER